MIEFWKAQGGQSPAEGSSEELKITDERSKDGFTDTKIAAMFSNNIPRSLHRSKGGEY